MGRFDRQIETARRLIAINGHSVVWRSITAGAVDPLKPARPTQALTVDYEVIMCFLPETRNGLASTLQMYINNTEIHGGSVYGLMGAVGFEPNLRDVVIRDGVQYDVSSIETLSPNDQKILYIVRFKA